MSKSLRAMACLIASIVPPVISPQSVPAAPRTIPTVIYNAGGEPIAQYLKYITPEKAQRDRRPMASAPMPIPMFPVVTTKAKPGLLGQPIRGKLKGGPDIPICVIGDDQLSRHWLTLNLATLEKMHASCLVVSVRDEAALRRLRESAGSLPLTPGSLDALATAAGIPVWPVLITPDGQISQ